MIIDFQQPGFGIGLFDFDVGDEGLGGVQVAACVHASDSLRYEAIAADSSRYEVIAIDREC